MDSLSGIMRLSLRQREGRTTQKPHTRYAGALPPRPRDISRTVMGMPYPPNFRPLARQKNGKRLRGNKEMFLFVQKKQNETLPETMKYTPTQALKLLDGVTRKKLYAMMKNSAISYETENNRRYIDGSELARVFGSNFRPEGKQKTFSEPEKKQSETVETLVENRLLQQKVEALEQRLADREKENEKLWERFNLESEERRKLTMLLTDMRQNPTETPAEAPKRFLGIFPRKNA